MLKMLTAVWFLALCMPLPAEEGRYGADVFTRIGPGMRAQGMGDAFCALADDATAVYWNPAGLPQIKRHQLYMMHRFLFGGSRYDFVALSVPMPGRAAFAVSWTGAGISGIPEYPALRGSREERMRSTVYRSDGTATGEFSDEASLFSFTFAKTFIIKYFTEQLELLPEPVYLYAGLGMKRYMQVLYGFTGTYTGLDAGILLNMGLNYSLFGETPRRDLNLAVAVQNAWDSGLLWNTVAEARDDVPRIVRLGASYSELLVRYRTRITAAYEQVEEYEVTRHAGVEASYRETVSVRAGYAQGAVTAGAGLRYRSVGVGYAFNNHELDALHSVGISYEF